MTSGRKDRRMHRATADRLLEGAVERAKAINADPGYCYTIERMVVFGSYANTERDDLGDLDIAVKLAERYPKDDPRWEKARGRYRGKPTDFLMRYDWPREEIIRELRNRNAFISVHRIGRDPEQDGIIFADRIIEIDLGGEE